MAFERTAKTVTRAVTRFDLLVREDYEAFCRRFEGAVPSFDRNRTAALLERGAAWPEIVADVAASARHHFQLYWKLDLTPLMSLAGNAHRAAEYLMGNHVIAETMYRHDPAVGLYVPLRCLIYERDDDTHFGVEQPSSALASLDCEAIARVGSDLDRKLAELLAVLNVTVPETLSRSAPRV
ncbi:MAG TPA: DUF302 domain-containing protein [Steroidobacteraceae bacterium]|nr:DUF302 domain-containing protein [Steroidobacteraceae bacterium]